jgi:hypothetical protein
VPYSLCRRPTLTRRKIRETAQLAGTNFGGASVLGCPSENEAVRAPRFSIMLPDGPGSVHGCRRRICAHGRVALPRPDLDPERGGARRTPRQHLSHVLFEGRSGNSAMNNRASRVAEDDQRIKVWFISGRQHQRPRTLPNCR